MIHSTTTSSPYSKPMHSQEPIAIIGIGCRFPGDVESPQSYWQLLLQGRDAIQQTPPNRWSLEKFYTATFPRPGKTQSRWGGYVNNLDQFDPQLFGIAPREAASMDPQQRMLLEVAFRAIEDAGQPMGQLSGRPVSVYVGISSFDYAIAGLSARDRGVIDAYSNTGGSSSIAANRISYCFDLRGPSVAVDTACSSSLVAVHMACESLWRGEAELALAGGVNALILPDFYVAFSQLGVLSPDGRCRTFDARANGYVRSEGAGMVLLKPLSAAKRDRDPIYALIRATALNQDGRTPGMTVPSQQAQQQLMESTCEKAGISPAEISYVEAHGTGTPVGDPIEANAIGSIVGRDSGRRQPCWVGSVKTNIGHLEAGAGIASLIKVALSMVHRQLPRHLHFQTPNPAIDFSELQLQIPTATTRWDVGQGEVRLAGINGFGYGGANGHVIVEQPPAKKNTEHSSLRTRTPRFEENLKNNTLHPTSRMAEAAPSRSAELHETKESSSKPVLLPISARSPQALRHLGNDFADWLSTEEGNSLQLAEVASYCAHRRQHFEVRASVVANTRAELIEGLRSLNAGDSADANSWSQAGKIAFVCCGQGPQWWAMGRGLLKYSPVFLSIIKRCDQEFRKHVAWSLLEELSRSEAQSQMQRTSIAQPSLFAIQIALAAVWESWGVRPDAIVGHSVGEIAAAYLSGGLSWEDACLVAIHRGRTMDLATSRGAMLAVGISADSALQAIVGWESHLSLAAINGPSNVTLSGDANAIERLAERFEADGTFCRRLAVEYAFHSPQMEPVRDELLHSLKGLHPRKTHTPIVSTVSGKCLNGTEFDGDYWWQNVRQSVRFLDAMNQLASLHIETVIELGPHPVLAYGIHECFQAAGHAVRSVASLNRKQDDLHSMTNSLGELYTWGHDIDWQGFYTTPVRKVNVPVYPFQRQRCWSESLESSMARLQAPDHPLLGERSSAPQRRWQQRIDLKLQDYLADHRVRGTAVYPAAAIVESCLAAALRALDQPTARLVRLKLLSPCVLAEDRPQWIETTFDAERSELQLFQRECSSNDWSPLATVQVSHQPLPAPSSVDTASMLREARERCQRQFDAARLYDYCGALGLQYGAAFRGVRSGSVTAGEAVVEVSLPTSPTTRNANNALHPTSKQFAVHPSLLDSCFHAMIAADPNFDTILDGLYLPSEIEEVAFHRPASSKVTVHARMRHKTRRAMVCDLTIFNSDGELSLQLKGFRSLRVHGGQERERTEDLLYSYAWTAPERNLRLGNAPTVRPGRPAAGVWLVLTDGRGFGQRLVDRLRQSGGEVIEVAHRSTTDHQYALASNSIDPESPADFVHVIQQYRSRGDELRGIVYLWGLDALTTATLSTEQLAHSTRLTTLAPLHLVQALEEQDVALTLDLTIVTAAAQPQDDSLRRVEVAQSPLIGFARVVVSEVSRLRTRLVDVSGELSTHDVDALLYELLEPDEEDEIAWSSGERRVRRFEPQMHQPLPVDVAQSLPSRLRIGESAGIEELAYRTLGVESLAEGEVEIEVLAAGLNFSDVMKALDLYPGLPDGTVELGAECSGRVLRVGANVDFSIGDEVIAVATGSFGTRVKVHQHLLAHKPKSLTHEQAAALPIAFLTADYALNECARLRSDETVLIHAASGGVGLAAMQLARNLGATILATAGNDEKRRVALSEGASHAMDSRSLNFGDETLEITGGRGVDVILNSLPGEAIRTGMSILKVGGRFLEIGKRDIYADASLGMHVLRNNLALFAIDLDQLFKLQPERMGQRLRSLVQQFDQGTLQPLPIREFPADDAAAAFRLMQQGKHIGKVVVSYRQPPQRVMVGEGKQLPIRGDATYWIAGGLGGFGLQVAKWLCSRGARHLVLTGRSAQPRSSATEVLAELQRNGVHVELLSADISDDAQVAQVLTAIDQRLPPLRGVFHTAMVLQDKLLRDLDRQTLEAVLRPKVLGGWNLHQATLDRELDMFVLFSSLSSVFGHAGQANYAAANAFLDSLAHERRATGLPGLAINWGHLGEVGYLAEREQLGQRLERQGVLSFTVQQALDALEYALRHGWVQLSVLRMNWQRWRGLGVMNRVSPRFAYLLQHDSTDSLGEEVLSVDKLRGASKSDRDRHILAMLRRKGASLLGIADAQLPNDRPLLELGLDSLMAVELRNWIENQLEINFPISTLMGSGDLRSLTDAIGQLLDAGSTSATPSIRPPASRLPPESTIGETQAAALLEELPNMSSEEVTRWLAEVLRSEST